MKEENDVAATEQSTKLESANLLPATHIYADVYEDPELLRFKTLPGFKEAFATLKDAFSIHMDAFMSGGWTVEAKLQVSHATSAFVW